MPMTYNEAKIVVKRVIQERIVDKTAIDDNNFSFGLIPKKELNDGWGSESPEDWETDGDSIITALREIDSSTFGSVNVDVPAYWDERLSDFRNAILNSATTS